MLILGFFIREFIEPNTYMMKTKNVALYKATFYIL